DFEYAQATRQHLEGVLLPDTDRCLTAGETGRVWSILERTLAASVDTDSFLSYLSACGIAVMLVTARDRSESMRALLQYLRGGAFAGDGLLRLSAGYWSGTCGHDLPELGDLPESWFYPVDHETR